MVPDEDRGRVPPDRHERAVAKRDLAGVAGEDVQPENADHVHADVGDLRGAEVAQPVRQHGDDGDARRKRGDLCRAQDAAATGHTRLTATRPNSPAGRIRSTPRITTNATGNWSASPT